MGFLNKLFGRQDNMDTIVQEDKQQSDFDARKARMRNDYDNFKQGFVNAFQNPQQNNNQQYQQARQQNKQYSQQKYVDKQKLSNLQRTFPGAKARPSTQPFNVEYYNQSQNRIVGRGNEIVQRDNRNNFNNQLSPWDESRFSTSQQMGQYGQNDPEGEFYFKNMNHPIFNGRPLNNLNKVRYSEDGRLIRQ
jgi:hypothetical protein